jgi:rSAM/selenodomain-associated transferase 1
LTPQEAVALSRCFLQDTAENISTICLQKKDVIGVAVYTPVESEQDFQKLLPDDFLLIPQRGESLGDRLHHAAEDLFLAGFDSVCLIGSDSPTLPSSCLKAMVEYLKWSREGVVIGPTIDGGYYAIGLKAPRRRLFEDISWSTDRVFEQTKARIAELALPHMTLPIWYDIDDEGALKRLFDNLCQKGQPRRFNSGYLANHTRRLLNGLFQTEDTSRT